MGSTFRWALGSIVLFSGPSFAQDQFKPEAPQLEAAKPEAAKAEFVKAHHAEVRFNDGSLVRMTILQANVEVLTKYGKLTIPLADIRRIDLGMHLPPGLDQQLDQSIRLLASTAYKEREDASREIVQAGHLAYPFLKRASRSTSDLEVAHRVTGLMKRIADKHSPDQLKMKEEDVIHTGEFTVIGRIASPTIKAHSAHFGDLALKLSDLRTVHLRASGRECELVVDAAKHGSGQDQWFDTGVSVDSTMRVVVLGEGQVDLWPQGPGQYLTTPKGYTTAGKGSTYMAGALVGRIGETGKVFLIGDRFDGSPNEEGKLLIQIVPAPWNNTSTGSYRVRITTDHMALTSR